MGNKLNGILLANGFPSSANEGSMYQNLAFSFKKAILNKQLRKDEKLPPTRLLASDLQISRSTVLKAYEILCIEKYVRAIHGSGYYVENIQQKKIKISLPPATKKNAKPDISSRARSFRKNVQLMNRTDNKGIAFRPGLPPLDIFPVRKWQQLTNNYWKQVTFSEMTYGASLGLESLRRNIADYLRIYRNIHCDYNQVVVVTGSLHSLSMVSDLLIDQNDQVILENPTYANALAIFKSLKAKLIPTDIDDEGLNIKSVDLKKLKKPKLIYTTPSNQYPTGVQMSLKRRAELLEWVSEQNCLIIEDDYDHEFSNWENPVASIFSLDKSDCVIYLGTFNKLLHPSIRLGYMIIPPFLVDEMRAVYEQTLRFISPVTQKVMSDFIEKNHLSNHLRKVVKVSNERRDFFVEQFQLCFGKEVKLLALNSGLHLIADISQVNDVDLSKYLNDSGITVFPYSKYFLKGPKPNGLVMGFSSVDNSIIKEKVRKMYQLYRKFLSLNGG
ncbi:MAG: PLP-dependent aminotransferase family protein [Balneolaceae bacterium]|nr:PLP-dependent aminotransferase family protein [Balneolaceae bacterium]MBO6547231.1 PLP-dependent aminotransferase family protein [Balneolaceae bacterium]MBO6647822.1 PLP-dependent aminotransferase family protein [Balneolaceae bacterium]